MDYVEAIRAQALLDAMVGDFDFAYRRICRWFSSTFHTPLNEVEDYPIEYVLKHYFECQFESMTKAQQKKVAKEITETKAEKKRKKKEAKTKTDDAFLERIAREAREAEQAAKLKKEQEEERVKQHIAELADKEMADLTIKDEPPDISLNFDEGGNLLDEDSLAPPRKR